MDGETYEPWVYLPDSPTELQIAGEAGRDLAQLYSNWVDWQAAGGNAIQAFESYSPLVPEHDLLQVKDEQVAIQAFADVDIEALRYSLAVAGFEEIASFDLGLSGWLPLQGNRIKHCRQALVLPLLLPKSFAAVHLSVSSHSEKWMPRISHHASV